jgi:hypothetical protein
MQTAADRQPEVGHRWEGFDAFRRPYEQQINYVMS